MVGIVLAILLLVFSSIFWIAFFNFKIENVFGTQTIAVVISLFVFYCFNLLAMGFLFTIIVLLAMGVLGCIRTGLRREIKSTLLRICTPGMTVFLGVLVIDYLVTRNNIVILSDPLRLWGGLPKALFYTEKLQLGMSSLIHSIESGYIPGMPLLVYFFEKINGQFTDSIIYFVYAFTVAIFFLPSLAKIKWEDKGKFILYTLVILLTPLIFYNNYELADCSNFYYSLFIDPILGMAMAYLLFLISKNPMENWRGTVQFSLALSFCTLLKDSGFVFAVIAILASVVMGIREKRGIDLKKTLIICLPSLLIYFGWGKMVDAYGLSGHSVNFSIRNIIDVQFIKEFLKKCCNFTILKANLSLPAWAVSLFAVWIWLLITVLLARAMLKKNKSTFMWTYLICVIMQGCFLLGLYILGLNGWNRNLPSFIRYVGTILVGELAYIEMFLLFNKDSLMICRKPIWEMGVTLCVLYAVIVIPIKSPDCFNLYSVYDDADRLAEDIAGEMKDENADVFLVCDGYQYFGGHILLRAYYDLLGSNIFIKNYVTEAYIADNKTAEEFIEELIVDDYDYVYFMYMTDEVIAAYKNILDGDVSQNRWYVDKENRKLVQL